MLRRTLALLLVLAAPAAAAQDKVIVVPLDPVDPTEVAPADPNAPASPQVLPALPGDNLVLQPNPNQDPIVLAPRPEGSVVGQDVTTVEEDAVTRGTGAVLKGLDKLAGTATDITLKTGETAKLGWLEITLGECRYPVDNPSGDAYAWVVIRDRPGEAPIFSGWMVASSPALDALDHARFDVWVKRCTTS